MMLKLNYQTLTRCAWLVAGLAALLLPVGTWAAVQSATTNLATMTVTPITRPVNAPRAWQTIYDFHGGKVPPGTRIVANGKWTNPKVIHGSKGITFMFPKLPAQPRSAGQWLSSGFEVERPIANYPTRVTLRYKSYFSQNLGVPYGWWSPIALNWGNDQSTRLFGSARGIATKSVSKAVIHVVGTNTIVCRFGGPGKPSVRVNGHNGAGVFFPSIKMPRAGAMLLPGIGVGNNLTQLPRDTGKWYSIRSFKIQQLRPPLHASAVAVVDLHIPGPGPVRVTIEVANKHNDSVGYVLRDSQMAPGNYKLYWDGVNQKQSQPVKSTWITPGRYTFRLTTSKVQVAYVGQPNNNTPAYNALTYAQVGCTALGLTPPGTHAYVAPVAWDNSHGRTSPDTTNSVQLVNVGYDSNSGEWIGAHGSVINTRVGEGSMQDGHAVAVTPPDPAHPNDPAHQFYFVSTSILPVPAVVDCSLPNGWKLTQKKFTSPAWNRTAPASGRFAHVKFLPNTLYADTVPPAPAAPANSPHEPIWALWQRGYYGLQIGDHGRLLFACNNADNRLEVRNIAGSGAAIAKISINYPMYVALAPLDAAGAPAGVRYVYVDSPKAGLLRIAWHVKGNTFGSPVCITPASAFAFPRGLTFDAAADRILVCDAYNLDRTKVANQIAVINPRTGRVLARFGKRGGVNPNIGGLITRNVFTCPLTIVADSTGAIWVNDYYTGEVRKYAFNKATNGFRLLRRVLGSNTTNISQFYWLPGAKPTQVWTVGNFFVRHDCKVGPDGQFIDQRATDAFMLSAADANLRPFTHLVRFQGHVYATFAGSGNVYEHDGYGWIRRLAFGHISRFTLGPDLNAQQAAEQAGLLAKPGQPPTALNRAITASGDRHWQTRQWAWSDLNGDGKMEYSAANPEFKIAFNKPIIPMDYIPGSPWLRPSDGAFVCPVGPTRQHPAGLVVIKPQQLNGHLSYNWADAQVIYCTQGPPIEDVITGNGDYFVLRSSTGRHDVGDGVISYLQCYSRAGKLLWTREKSDYSIIAMQPLGRGLMTSMERSWSVDGPVSIRTLKGDLVCRVFCRQQGDCWSDGVLRVNANTAMIGLVQAYKVTGLTTVRTATATVKLHAARP